MQKKWQRQVRVKGRERPAEDHVRKVQGFYRRVEEGNPSNGMNRERRPDPVI